MLMTGSLLCLHRLANSTGYMWELLSYAINENMGETAEDAVKREVFEETGVNYEIDHLAVIHENFFNDSRGSLKDMDCHEIALYFVMKSRGIKELNSNSFTQGVRENMYWLPIAELEKYKAFPSFMKEYLQSGHTGVEHIVSDERTEKQ